MEQTVDIVDLIIRYENGETDARETLELFGELIRTGHAWMLQGHYGRTAAGLIERGFLTLEGDLTDRAHELLED